MALNLSDLTSPSTSDNVLSDIYTTADQGDGIALMDDLSPNDIDATQTTANEQPIAYVNSVDGTFARFDGSDDHMSFTLTESITNGTVFFATKKGSYAANINLGAKAHDFSGNKISDNYNFANDLVALYLFESALTQDQINQLTEYFVTKGAVEDYGAVTSFSNAWREFSSLTSFPENAKLGTEVNNVNFSGAWQASGLTSFSTPLPTATNVASAWNRCSSLTSFNAELPLANYAGFTFYNCSSLTSFNSELPSVRYFGGTWLDCSSLTDFSADVLSNWNPASINSGVFDRTWEGCSSLTSQSVENILTSIDESGKWATNDGTSSGTTLTDPEIDIDYDGSELTPATTAAITNLQNKNWVININP